ARQGPGPGGPGVPRPGRPEPRTGVGAGPVRRAALHRTGPLGRGHARRCPRDPVDHIGRRLPQHAALRPQRPLASLSPGGSGLAPARPRPGVRGCAVGHRQRGGRQPRNGLAPASSADRDLSPPGRGGGRSGWRRPRGRAPRPPHRGRRRSTGT
ncbi:hypothetical protein HMPREF0059_00700, partial [Actinomyces viscosus C505]